MAIAEIAAAIGKLLAPIIEAIFPLVLDEFKKGPTAIRIRATKEDRTKNEEDWNAWDDAMRGVDVPADYPFRVRP